MNFVAAMRCLYRRAVQNGHFSKADNPPAKVQKTQAPTQPPPRHKRSEVP